MALKYFSPQSKISHGNGDRLSPGNPLRAESEALALTIHTIRNVQGKKNPDNFATSTSAWNAVTRDFPRNSYRAMGGDPDELDEPE